MPDPLAAAPELKRLRRLVRFAFAWALLIFGRLAYLQIFAHERFLIQAGKQQEESLELLPPRGAVRDRKGVFLAVSVPAWSVILNPRTLPENAEPAAVDTLVRLLHLDRSKLTAALAAARDTTKKKKPGAFLRVKNRIEPAEYEALKAWVDSENKRTPSLEDNIAWLSFHQESRRAYPHGELAAPLIGSVDYLENGNAGIELSYQRDLEGQPGKVRLLKAPGQMVDALEMHPATPGKNVTLTIDSQLQFLCDTELAAAVRDNGFQTGTIIAMNPHNGEIYAMSAYPSFDPNIRPKAGASRLHLAISQALDGGSVMKMYTIAGAMEHRGLTAATEVDGGVGAFRRNGTVIGDDHPLGRIRAEKALWLSSNNAAINIGIRLGRELLWQTLHDFGFGQKTGIRLPGESAGVLRSLDRWKDNSLYYVSMGHELGVTTMQLAQGASVFANGGYRVTPKVVLSKQSDGGPLELEPESPKVRVIRGETAVDMRTMSEGVVLYGTGKAAKVKGFPAGGKTGTAQMLDRSGRYVKVYSSSFMGYAPVNVPKVVVVVTLNGGRVYGGVAAAPVFAKVTAAALNMLGEEGEIQEDSPAAPARPQPKPEAKMLAQALPPVPEAAPAPAPPSHREVVTGPTVPDFAGMDKRAVLRASAQLGVPVEMSGAGLARGQTPPAGSALAMGGTVRVRFSR